jgi:hypothetical protein
VQAQVDWGEFKKPGRKRVARHRRAPATPRLSGAELNPGPHGPEY